MKKIFYVGDWAIKLGPVFAETSFNYAYKGLETFHYNQWLVDAFQSGGTYQVTSIPTWEFYMMPPGEYERVLSEYDALVFSDVEAKNFQLAPDFFDRKRFGKEPLTFPDRVNLTVQAVHGGTHMLFLGGWLSFSGEIGKGGWGRTRLQEILPVRCLPTEDLRESTEGFVGQICLPDHPHCKNLSIETMPPILGYNQTLPREDCSVLAVWKNSSDPMIAVGQFGKGKVFAYTSDPAPHWGCNFVYWDGYQAFWRNTADWLFRD